MLFDADRENKTICALASAQGRAALSVIRLSGPNSFKIISQACPSLQSKNLESHKVYLSKFYDLKKNFIDQVVLTLYANGKSYTGEESVEISCHGSPHITQKILESLIDFGAVIAEKGEFTYRAFMNDRLDLIQAEAVLSVIESQSDSSLKVSLRQLEGKISEKFSILEDHLTWCLAHIEASIDFSTEGLDVVDTQVLINKLESVTEELKKIIYTYKQGRILKDGLKVVLAGLPNVGKSSLLNNILLQDKAIVTDIAGTTRDVVEGHTLFNGVKFNISDTAGLRDTADVVENIGVERSKKEIASSDITLFVFDCSDGLKSEDVKILQSLSGQVLIVANKIDKNIKFKPQDIAQKLQTISLSFSVIDVLGVSALDENARDIILNSISNIIGLSSFSDDSVISTARQHELSTQALELIEQSVMELKNDLGSEFIAQTLKNALISLQRILGKSYDDQIMDRVFKEFCLGK